jgi:L-ascorbate metabolism protein UlaG (beta-lactamase superfamily)
VERVAFLGHSTVLLELGGVRLLTDPLLRERVGPMRRRPPAPVASELGALDAVLISHIHRDHVDAPSLRSLDPATPVIAPRGSLRLLERIGLRDVTEVDEGESIGVGAVEVSAVPAVHGGPRTPYVGGHADCVGYVVGKPAGDAPRVYFAGDTEVFPAMAELAPLELAMLPVWGWGPTLGPGHMNPAQAAEALALLRPRFAIPIHWGTIHMIGLGWLQPRWLTDPPHEFARRAAEVAPDVDVRVLEPGASLDVPGPAAS